MAEEQGNPPEKPLKMGEITLPDCSCCAKSTKEILSFRMPQNCQGPPFFGRISGKSVPKIMILNVQGDAHCRISILF